MLGALVSLSILLGIPCIITYAICSKKINKRRLGKEIESWHENKIISETSYQNLLQHYPISVNRHPINLMQVVYIVASLFIGIGFILFIASNWQHLQGWLKLGMMFVLAALSLLFGEHFRHKKTRGLPLLGEGLVLLSALLWGAVIIFLFQAGQWAVHYNAWMVGVWIISIVPLLLFLKSEPLYYLILLLSFIWGISMKELSSYALLYYFIPLVFLLIWSRQQFIKELLLWISSGLIVLFVFNPLESTVMYLILLAGLTLLLAHKRQKSSYLAVSASALILLATTSWNFAWLPWHWIAWVFIAGGLMIGIKKTASKLSLILFLCALYVQIPGWLHALSLPGELITSMIMISGGVSLLIGLFCKTKSDWYYSWTWPAYIASLIGLFFVSSHAFLKHEGIDIARILPLLPLLAGCCLVYYYWKINRKEGLNFYPMLIFFAQGVVIIAMVIFPQALSVRVLLNNFMLLFTIVLTFFWANHENQTLLFYVGMLSLLIFTLLRYVDLFWSMLDRSLFFILGGVLLMLIGILLEKQKKHIIEEGGGS